MRVFEGADQLTTGTRSRISEDYRKLIVNSLTLLNTSDQPARARNQNTASELTACKRIVCLSEICSNAFVSEPNQLITLEAFAFPTTLRGCQNVRSATEARTSRVEASRPDRRAGISWADGGRPFIVLPPLDNYLKPSAGPSAACIDNMKGFQAFFS